MFGPITFSRILALSGVKVIGQFLAFGLSMLIARNLSLAEAGDFFYVNAIVISLAAIASFGSVSLIVKTYGAHGITRESTEVFITLMMWVIALNAIIIIFIDIVSPLLFSHYFSVKTLSILKLLQYQSFAIVGISLCSVIGAAYQGVHKPYQMMFVTSIGLNFVMCMVMIVYLFSDAYVLDKYKISWIYSAISLVILLIACLAWFGLNSKASLPVKFRNPALLQSASNMWGIVITGILLKYSSLLISGFFLPMGDVALLAVAVRLADVLSLFLLSLNNLVPPIIAKHWHQKELGKMKEVTQKASRFILLVTFLMMSVLFLFAQEILQLFGENYTGAVWLLYIVGVGNLVRGAFGLSGDILNMTGFEKTNKYTAVSAMVLTVGCSLVLLPLFGVLGAAISISIGVALSSGLASIFVKKKLGFGILI